MNDDRGYDFDALPRCLAEDMRAYVLRGEYPHDNLLLCAVLVNDLRETHMRARRALIVTSLPAVVWWCAEYLPIVAWGSVKTVDQWCIGGWLVGENLQTVCNRLVDDDRRAYFALAGDRYIRRRQRDVSESRLRELLTDRRIVTVDASPDEETRPASEGEHTAKSPGLDAREDETDVTEQQTHHGD